MTLKVIRNMVVISSITTFLFIFINSRDTATAEDVQEVSTNWRSTFGTLHTLKSLSYWASREESVSTILAGRLNLVESEIKLIERYLIHYQETHIPIKDVRKSKQSASKPKVVLGYSAVLGHRMTTRYVDHASALKELLTSVVYLNNQAEIHEILDNQLEGEELESNSTMLDKEEDEVDKSYSSNDTIANERAIEFMGIDWPNWKDKYMSSLTFIHIQEVNGFYPEELQYGSTIDTGHTAKLNSDHCLEIGIFALHRNYYFMAVEWLELAKTLKQAEGDSKMSQSQDLVSSLLNVARQDNNQLFRYIQQREDKLSSAVYGELYQNLYLHPIYEEMPLEKRTPGKGYLYHAYKAVDDHRRTYSEHIDLCMGNMNQTPEMEASLKCHYESKRHPYLYINPVKVEQLSISPPINQFYEVIGDREIERVKAIAGRYLKFTTVVGGHGTVEETTKHRTSVGTGMFHEELPTEIKLGEILTGLDLFESSEVTQYAEYTYGRHYSFHSDAYGPLKRNTTDELYDDRLATILYYLEIPKLGGVTPFCKAGVSGRMVRGSAIFWYNMYRNGTVREDVEHAACPVLHGHKIILNHWVKYLGNFNHYKCSLDQLE